MTQQSLHHLAIIPDGNRRWAKKHGLMNTLDMYNAGGDMLSKIVLHAFERQVAWVTVWIGSRANLSVRSGIQVRVLENLYISKFNELARHPRVHENRIKVEIIGEWQGLVKDEVNTAIERVMDTTKHYDSGRQLTILVGYDGRRERGMAVQRLLQEQPQAPNELAAAEQLLRQHAWTGHLPDVDLMIRTGAWQDPHNSAAFLSLLTNESQYAFPQVLWPDLSTDMFDKIIDDYNQRERRMGR